MGDLTAGIGKSYQKPEEGCRFNFQYVGVPIFKFCGDGHADVWNQPQTPACERTPPSSELSTMLNAMDTFGVL